MLIVMLASLLIPQVAAATSRVAFVVGNSTYENAPPLPNPSNDTQLVARTLEDLGFDVTRRVNLSRWEIAAELSNFLKKTEGAELTLFYFAGHGMQFEGRNYLLGTEARLETEFDIQAEALDLSQITRHLRRNSRAALIFVDACRDNPVASEFYRRTLPATRSASLRGLAEPTDRFDGAMVTFSASPGQVAYDGRGAYSPFAEALARHLPTPNIEILTLMKRVIGDVRTQTDERQVPMVSNDLSREIYLREVALPVAGDPQSGLDDIELERAAFDAAKSMATLHGWARYFDMYPNGRLSELALEAEHDVLMSEAAILLAGFRNAKPIEDIPRALADELEERLGIGRTDIVAVQALLKREGFYDGSLDGVAGSGTRAAIRAFETASGLRPTGVISRAMTQKLGLKLRKFVDRPRISSFRRKEITRAQVAALGMDEQLFAHTRDTAQKTSIIYGYRGNRLYVATADFFTHVNYIPRLIESGDKIYPVSVGSADENQFIYDLVRNDGYFWQWAFGRTEGPMIGLWQRPGSLEPASGWAFVGDESSTFRAWDRRQPDNHNGNQNYARIWFDGTNLDRAPDVAGGPRWDDASGFANSVVLEIELD